MTIILLTQVNDVMDCVSASIVHWRDVTLHTTAYDSSGLAAACFYHFTWGRPQRACGALWDYL